MRRDAIALVLLLGCGDDDTPRRNPDSGSPDGTMSCGGEACPGDCYPDDWCVEDSHPMAFYTGLWVESADSIWLLEQNGTVRHGSGTTWTERPIPGATAASSIVGGAAGEVFVAIEPFGIVRWDGSAWVPEMVVDPPAVASFERLVKDEASGDVFAYAMGRLFKRTDAQWSLYARVESTPRSLMGAATCGGTQHFSFGSIVDVTDGIATAFGIPLTARTVEATALGGGGVVAVGEQVVRYDGQWKYSTIAAPSPVRSAGARAHDDVYMLDTSGVLWHFDGRAWSEVWRPGDTSTPNAVYVYGDDVLIGSTSGAIRRLTERGVELFVPVAASWTTLMNGSFLASATDFYAAVSGRLYRFDAGPEEWRDIGEAPPVAVAMWASSPTDVWFVSGSADIHHWDGMTLRRMESGFTVAADQLTAVRGSSSTNVWIAGGNKVLQWDGTRFRDHTGAQPTDAEGATSLAVDPENTWVFRGNHFGHFDGDTWITVGPAPDVLQIACEGDEIVGIGSQPLVLWQGVPGALRSASSQDAEYSVAAHWITSASNAWVIGDGETQRLRKITGDIWGISIDRPRLPLTAIQSLPDGQAFAISNRTLLHRR